MIDAVLFDLDGTLADTAPDMARTVNAMRERRGLAPVPLSQVRPFVSRGARGMITSAFAITTEHPDYATLREEFLDLYAGNLCVDTCLFPGMDELLVDLENRSIGWGVVTNKYERLARPVMAGLGLGDRAAVIVGGDTCARAKPFPDPLLHAVATMGVAPVNTLYVGDDERDIQAARAAGMPVVAAAYGYLADGPPPSMWGADAVVESPAELHAWIREH
ncbi:MAG TPA: phosphoglycolate phosphatase [Usitatibacter sp.]|nr:phosphoglycolate phosphatase [Usitatibacter sp.]